MMLEGMGDAFGMLDPDDEKIVDSIKYSVRNYSPLLKRALRFEDIL
jgi:hypothetical protein